VTATQRIAALVQQLEDKKREMDALSFDVMRMRAMLEHSPVGVFQDDGATEFGWVRTLSPEDLPELRKRHNEARAVNGQFAVDYRIIRPNGEIRWVHGQSAPIFSPTGMLLGYLGTIHDITDRVETRNALEKLRDSLENTILERVDQDFRISSRSSVGVVKRRSINDVIARKISALLDSRVRSYSLLRRRYLLSQPKVRSTQIVLAKRRIISYRRSV
jgi:hypothetical protein